MNWPTLNIRPQTRLWLLLVFMALLIAACSRRQIVSDTTPETAVPTLEIAARDPTPARPAETFQAPPTPITGPTAEGTSLPNSEPGITDGEERCGVRLPLISPPSAPAVDELQGILIPADMLPEEARPALQRILDEPGSVGLAAFEIGRESEGVYLNAGQPMPLASVAKIINLIAYAERVNAGELNPAAWIPLSDLESLYLPGLDLGAHNRALNELDDRSLIAYDPPATPLEEIPWMMIRHSSNAASDYLQRLVGQEQVESTIVRLGLDSHTAPCPWVGQFLIMTNHTRQGSDRQAVEAYIADPDRFGLDVMRLTEAYATDAAFRQAELGQPRGRSAVQTQILFGENLNAQASAADYAGLMARILQNQIGADYTNFLVRRALEWPMIFSENQDLFSTVGYKNGVLPGILTTAYYAQRLEDGAQVVVVLFYRQLPMGIYREWRRNLAHDELARWLLSDPDAIPTLRDLLCCPAAG